LLGVVALTSASPLDYDARDEDQYIDYDQRCYIVKEVVPVVVPLDRIDREVCQHEQRLQEEQNCDFVENLDTVIELIFHWLDACVEREQC